MYLDYKLSKCIMWQDLLQVKYTCIYFAPIGLQLFGEEDTYFSFNVNVSLLACLLIDPDNGPPSSSGPGCCC